MYNEDVDPVAVEEEDAGGVFVVDVEGAMTICAGEEETGSCEEAKEEEEAAKMSLNVMEFEEDAVTGVMGVCSF